MPLSEDEERILNQIEQTLYRQDPASAERIGSTTLVRYLARNCRWAALGFFVGLVIVVVSLASSWILGILGFAVMTACAVIFTHNLRRIGRHGWQQVTRSVRDRNVNDVVGDTTRRLRRRFGDDRDGDT